MFPVDVTLICSDGHELPTTTIKVVGEVVESATAFPPLVQFGTVPLGEVCEEYITLYSRTGAQLEARHIAVPTNSDAFVLRAKREPESANLSYRISVKAARVGDHLADVVFTLSSADAERPIELRVPVAFTAVPD